MKQVAILLILILFSACNMKEENKTSEAIFSQLKNSDWRIVDFAKTVPFPFEKVCILGPYSSNKYAEQTLGFYWDIETETDIGLNEGINLIAFIKNNEVIYHVEHPRNKGDFWKLSGKCLNYKSSTLTRVSRKDDWTY